MKVRPLDVVIAIQGAGIVLLAVLLLASRAPEMRRETPAARHADVVPVAATPPVGEAALEPAAPPPIGAGAPPRDVPAPAPPPPEAARDPVGTPGLRLHPRCCRRARREAGRDVLE